MKKFGILAGLLAGAIAPCADQMVADFDNQLLGTIAPAIGNRYMWSTVDGLSSGQNRNVTHYSDPQQLTGTFPQGSFFNTSAIRDGAFAPAGNGTDQLYRFRFSFRDTQVDDAPNQQSADPKDALLRAFCSSSASQLRTPIFDASKWIAFDIHSDHDIQVCVAIGEGVATVPVLGGPGNGAGPLKFIGGVPGSADEVTPYVTLDAPGGYDIPANTWRTVYVNLNDVTKYSVAGFTGTGPIVPATGPGFNYVTLNSLMFSPTVANQNVPISYDIHIDNIRISDGPVTSSNVTGNVLLDQYVGDVTTEPVTFEFEDSSATITTFSNVALDSSGNYSIATGLPDGTYSVYAKAATFLRKKVSNVTLTGGGASAVDFSLINGDVDGSNNVDIVDYLTLVSAFDTNLGDSGYNPNADLDKSTGIDLGDYLIMTASFDMIGD